MAACDSVCPDATARSISSASGAACFRSAMLPRLYMRLATDTSSVCCPPTLRANSLASNVCDSDASAANSSSFTMWVLNAMCISASDPNISIADETLPAPCVNGAYMGELASLSTFCVRAKSSAM